MKVTVNFNSSNPDDIEQLRGELVKLIHKIDIELGVVAEADEEDTCCDCGGCDKCCCEEATDEIAFYEEFIDDAREGRVTRFLNSQLSNMNLVNKVVFDDAFVLSCIGYGFFKTHSDVDNFVIAFKKLSEREAERVAKDTIVSKLVDAGITKAFAEHVVDTYSLEIDANKIPSKYNEYDFIRLLEYLGIKEDFIEKQKQEDKDKLMKYLFGEIKKLSEISKGAADAAYAYFKEFEVNSYEEVDEQLANIKKQFKISNKTEKSSETESKDEESGNSYVTVDEVRGQNKRPPIRKSASDKKSNKKE